MGRLGRSCRNVNQRSTRFFLMSFANGSLKNSKGGARKSLSPEQLNQDEFTPSLPRNRWRAENELIACRDYGPLIGQKCQIIDAPPWLRFLSHPDEQLRNGSLQQSLTSLCSLSWRNVAPFAR